MRSFFEAFTGKLCEIGDKKPTNQDCIFTKNTKINGKQAGLFLVADGVGGLSSGDVISNMIALYFKRWLESIEKLGLDEKQVSEKLDEIIHIINQKAFEYSQSVGQRMGSTIALLFFIGNRYYIKNIGDSRIYLHDRKKGLNQLSYDHSFVAELVRNGEISEMEAKVHPKRNILLSCIGVQPEVKCFSMTGNLCKGDLFLLCSDGFYNYAQMDKVLLVLNDNRFPLEEKISYLRRCIPHGNAKDNVSIILVSFKKRMKLF